MTKSHGSISYDEPSFLVEMTTPLRGRNRWLAAWVMVWIFVFSAAAVYCGVQFFTETTADERVSWGLGLGLFVLVVAMLKSWYWMEINKNAVLREVRRLEAKFGP